MAAMSLLERTADQRRFARPGRRFDPEAGFVGCSWLFRTIIFRWLLFGAAPAIYGLISGAWSMLAVFE
jgi:hypothetical protein